MRIGETWLIRVADSTAAITEYKVILHSLLNSRIQFLGKRVIAAHKRRQAWNVVRHSKGALPIVGFHPAPTEQLLLEIIILIQAVDPSLISRQMRLVAQFLGKLRQRSVLKRPLHHFAGTCSTNQQLIATLHRLAGRLDLSLGQQTFLPGRSDQWRGGATTHDAGVAAATDTTRKHVPHFGILQHRC